MWIGTDRFIDVESINRLTGAERKKRSNQTSLFLCNHGLYGLVIGTISLTTSRAIKVFTDSRRGLAHTWRSPGSQHIASLAKLCAIPLQALGIEMILLHTKCSFNKSRVSLIKRSACCEIHGW